ncbi:Uncharacterised protein [Mycobacteroides abscessus subsp. abscessus]|nr:Uncharacterised protein [Mycobacteroides abscessus subsp. abscessus]
MKIGPTIPHSSEKARILRKRATTFMGIIIL